MIDYTLRGRTHSKDNILDVERQVHIIDSYSAADVTLSLRDVSQQIKIDPYTDYQRSFDLAVSFNLDLWMVDATLMRVFINCFESNVERAQPVLEKNWVFVEPQRQLLARLYERLQDELTIGAIKECYQTEQSPRRALLKRRECIVDLDALAGTRNNTHFLPEIFVDYSSDTFAEIARVREQELHVQHYLQTHFATARKSFLNLPREGRLISLVAEFESKLKSFVPYSLPQSPYFQRKETPEEQVQRDETIRQIVAGRCEDITHELKKNDRVGKMRVDGKMVDCIRPANTPERSFIKHLDQPIELVKNS